MRLVPTLGAISAAVCAIGSSASAQSVPSACARAWNHGAPAALRASIAARDPVGAFVDGRIAVGSLTWSKTGASSSSGARGCGIQFILGDGETLTVWGAWRGAVIVSWAGPVRSTRPLHAPNNSHVHADGTVGFHG
jgi:hypothetical protein